MAANAALLDELMGRNRNLAPEDQKAAEVHFDHQSVCKYLLCGFCPHELFRNTRVDIGPCDKIHDDALVEEYKASKKYQRMGFEDDFNRFVQSLITDIDKRIRRGEQRLQLSQGGASSARDERLQWLSTKISDLHREAEQLGCDGKVSESQRLMKQAEEHKTERETLERQIAGAVGGTKEMEVCPVCGSFQVKNETPAKVEEHISGRQHIGYATLRGYMKGLEEDKIKKEEKAKAEEEERRKRREEEDRKRSEERERRRRRSRSRSRSGRGRRSRSRGGRRSRSRDRRRSRRSRSRDRRRSRSRERRRSRSRDRRRSRSRDRRRSRRSRSRDRRRSRSRDRRSRDRRSRSKDRRSRSRDRSSRDGKRSRRSRSRERRRSTSRRSRSGSKPRSRSASKRAQSPVKTDEQKSSDVVVKEKSPEVTKSPAKDPAPVENGPEAEQMEVNGAEN